MASNMAWKVGKGAFQKFNGKTFDQDPTITSVVRLHIHRDFSLSLLTLYEGSCPLSGPIGPSKEGGRPTGLHSRQIGQKAPERLCILRVQGNSRERCQDPLARCGKRKILRQRHPHPFGRLQNWRQHNHRTHSCVSSTASSSPFASY